LTDHPAHHWIDTTVALDAVVDRAVVAPAYAVDTEFHREKTYWPQLALVQLTWGEEIFLIDPLSVDVAPLARLLDGPGVAVMHASGQDLEVLELACGTVPAQLFDTQIAAGFIGMSNPSLANLVDRMLGVRVAKADRLTDWLRRPLADDQLNYAASDVEHLLEIDQLLRKELAERGRLQWAIDECEDFRSRPRASRDPDEAWIRVKEARALRGRAAAVAQSVAAWRERRAASLDQPTRYVLSDLALLSIAQRPPGSLEALGKVRGFDSRAARGAVGQELVAAVQRGLEAPVPSKPDNRGVVLDGRLRPAVGLVSAWISQLAHDLELDTALLGTRTDIEGLVAGDPRSRLRTGWRSELVGTAVDRLVTGGAAVAFEADGKLVLEERSGHPITPSA
jgi:ribonuclease D